MNAVMVVHGPAAFDAGDVERLMGLLCPRRVLVAGVMARTAAEESGLPVTCTDERPSRVLSDLREPAFLLNRGKTPESGRIFGEIVAGRLPGLVHVETSSGTVYCWNRGDAALAEEIAIRTGCDLVHARSAAKPQDGLREIRGCIPGEAVFVNGIVIGTAAADTVVLAMEDGSLKAVSGLDPKPHGFEKLLRSGLPDITRAWCKSWRSSTTAATPSIRRSGMTSAECLPSVMIPPPSAGTSVLMPGSPSSAWSTGTPTPSWSRGMPRARWWLRLSTAGTTISAGRLQMEETSRLRPGRTGWRRRCARSMEGCVYSSTSGSAE